MSGVMFLNSSLICPVSSPTVMILNVHTSDLNIPHIQFKAAKQGNRWGYGKGPLLLSHATTNVSLGN
jgi:hypothetical protein